MDFYSPKPKKKVINSISAKEIWSNTETNRIEEKCMSPFISSVIDEISEITGYELVVKDIEVFVGDFRADIVCKDVNTEEIVVIENQLESSDHSHLGKSLTYFANLEAKAIVWISEKFRPEHIKAIENLNEITSEDYNFYALELKFEHYNGQEPFYYFNEVVVPTLVSKVANSIRAQSEDSLDVIRFLERFVIDLKTDIPSAHFNKGKTYSKLSFLNGVYLGFGISPRTDLVTFEISTSVITDENELAQLNKKIEERLNKKYNYNFVHSLGKKNPKYQKWLYTISLDRETEIELLKEICMNIYTEMTNS